MQLLSPIALVFVAALMSGCIPPVAFESTTRSPDYSGSKGPMAVVIIEDQIRPRNTTRMKEGLEDELTRRGIERDIVVFNGTERDTEQVMADMAARSRLLVVFSPLGGTYLSGVLTDVTWDVRVWDLNAGTQDGGHMVWKATIQTHAGTTSMRSVLGGELARSLVDRLIREGVVIPGPAPMKAPATVGLPAGGGA